jgi:hypothetical protein
MATSNFATPGHALVYMVECTMATLEHSRMVKRTPKSEIKRLESIIASGLASCRKFNLQQAAHESRCPRVATALLKEPTDGDG